MLRYFTIIFFSIINFSNCFAEPSPFGIEINRSTYKDVKQKYSGTDAGINKYSQGKMYDIDCRQISIEGIKSIRAIFNENEKLLALIATFDKYSYKSLVDSLSQKYKLVSKKDAFVGDKFSRFKADNTIVDLEAPHMSFDLTLSYIHNDFEKMYLDVAQEEKQKIQKEQTNSL